MSNVSDESSSLMLRNRIRYVEVCNGERRSQVADCFRFFAEHEAVRPGETMGLGTFCREIGTIVN